MTKPSALAGDALRFVSTSKLYPYTAFDIIFSSKKLNI